ncbi:MAG: NAD-dependent epimerase/dehydratase family protein [Bacteroidota bacterium]
MSNKQETIFITGATGFLGSYILRYLVKQGYNDIRALRRPDSPMNLVEPVKDKVEWITGDLLDHFLLEGAMQGVDKVYHAAALVSHERKDRDAMRRINAEGTATVVNAALYSGIKKFLHISSIAAIGRNRSRQHIDENNKWERSPFNSNYAISKYLAEQEVWRAGAEGLNIAILNPSIILGSGFWDRGTARLFRQLSAGMRFYPVGASAYVDVRDVARMAIQLMESDIEEERIIASAVNLSYRQLFSQIAPLLGKKPPSIRVNPRLAQVAAIPLSLWASLTGRRSALSRETALMTSCHFTYGHQKSKQLLDFEYLPFQQSLEEICEQFLKEGQGEASFLPI